MSARRALVVAVAACLLLGGCSNDMSGLKAYVAKVKARKVTKIPPVPRITPYIPFTFTDKGRRDPFQPQAGAPKVNIGNSKLRPDMNRPKQFLEQFPLDALSMVGVIRFKGVTYAMIQAPNGVIYQVTVGQYMGQNFGKVVKISSQKVDLIEIVPNGFGGWEKRPASISLAE